MTTTTTQHAPTSTQESEADPLRFAVIVASVRKQRLGRVIADWVAAQVPEGVRVDVIDLADVVLPDDELIQPGGGQTTALSERIAEADGYLIVTPEINHSYPASLKRAIDWHYDEWRLKAAAMVTYGAQGGLFAASHLREVFAELSVVTTRRIVGLGQPWAHTSETGYEPDLGAAGAMASAIAELCWWSETVRHARRTRTFPG